MQSSELPQSQPVEQPVGPEVQSGSERPVLREVARIVKLSIAVGTLAAVALVTNNQEKNDNKYKAKGQEKGDTDAGKRLAKEAEDEDEIARIRRENNL